MKTLTKWKLAATGVVGVLVYALTRPTAKKPAPKPVVKPAATSGSIAFSQTGSVTETIANFATGVEYKKTWTKAEWDKRTAALNEGDPYMDDSWKRQSQMTDDDWARREQRDALVTA